MMRSMKYLCSLAAVAIATSATAQSVSLSLTSPQNGTTVSPGATVNWSISFTVSTGNNQGLALLATDLVQDPANPALFDLTPAGSVPSPMANFSRPAGISNPGETNPVTGYGGVLRGTAGQRNLIQIGGAQNTFGQARPAGSGMAENASVVGGVGQSGSVVLASGSFAAPATGGAYTFSLANAVANVLTAVNTPPQFSPVVNAPVTLAAPSFSFTVGAPNCPGDLDGDNDVDISDLSTLLSQFGSTGPGFSGDLDNDNDVDISDLSALLSNFGTNC
ncbi:MAG: hypothetical protein IT450_00475 [Phycisphaerales bacterium]|nr:hypothetical protein [Phycisphaerales bacterium]